jgi:CBS domain-containing protein
MSKANDARARQGERPETQGRQGAAAEPLAPAMPAPAQELDPHLGLVATPVRSLLRRAPVTLSPGASIRDAAVLMREQHVSSVLLVDDGRLAGIFTDRDLRNRVVAAGVATDRPVSEVATAAPLTIGLEALTFEALLLMARNNVHHVPVMDGQRVAGMITATDLTEHRSASPVFLVSEIHEQRDVEGLARVGARVRDLQRNLAAADATAHATGQVITAITDAVTIRLLQLGEQRFGPPPVGYAWVAAGSQARCEQTAKTDQDNFMILDDAYDAALHGEYFEALARFVCDGLDACGYVHCPGGIMAMTDTWRQPLHTWKQYFRQWIGEPEPKALMLTCVFFDLRHIHGSAGLVDALQEDFLARARGNGIFLAFMVGNALGFRPPLNLFGNIAPARKGEHRGTVDLKHNGIVPVVHLARISALAAGHPQANTQERLELAADGGEISEQSARDLRDAFEFLSVTRIRHQARQIAAGQPPDNFMAPRDLSNFERTQLRQAFAVVQSMQSVLGQRHQAGRF